MRIAAISRALAFMLSIGGGMTLIALKPEAAEAQAPPSLAQVVALDECDPATFNAALGPGFCLNVTPFGSAVLLSDLLALQKHSCHRGQGKAAGAAKAENPGSGE